MSKSRSAAPARILHVVGRMDRAGAETMLMNYYRAIDRQQYQFDFLVFGMDPGDYDEEIESLGGRVVHLDCGNWLTRTVAMYRLMRGGPWVAVHAHTNFSNMFPLLAAVVARVPLRISHSHATAYTPGSLIRQMYQALAPSVIRRISTNRVACSMAASRFLYGTDDSVAIIPNAISAETFMLDRQLHAARLRQELGVGSDVLLVLQVGRIDSGKNQLFAVEVARALRLRGHKAAFLFVGRGEMERELQHRIAEYGLTAELRMLGVRDDIPRLFNAADVLILPSLFEGFPVVLVEAQAAGIPCVVSDRVAPEVDFGLNLLEFLPVPSEVVPDQCERLASVWADALQQVDHFPIPSKAQRQRALESSGYSVTSATSKLTDLYDMSARAEIPD